MATRKGLFQGPPDSLTAANSKPRTQQPGEGYGEPQCDTVGQPKSPVLSLHQTTMKAMPLGPWQMESQQSLAPAADQPWVTDPPPVLCKGLTYTPPNSSL